MFAWHLSECVWMWLSLLAQRYCRTLFKRLMNDDTPQPWRIELVSKSGLKWRIRWGGMCETRGPNASCPLRSLNIKLAFIKQEDGSDRGDARKQTWHRWRATKMTMILTKTQSFEFHVFSPEKKTHSFYTCVSQRFRGKINPIKTIYTIRELNMNSNMILNSVNVQVLSNNFAFPWTVKEQNQQRINSTVQYLNWLIN